MRKLNPFFRMYAAVLCASDRRSEGIGRSVERSMREAGSRMLGFVTVTLPALQDWGFRGMGQRWALSLLCLQSIRWEFRDLS